MSSVETAVDEIQLCLDCCQKLLDEQVMPALEGGVEASDDQAATLHWVQQQITALVAQMAGLKADLESGLNPVYLGYASLDDLLEAVADMALAIKALERVAKEIAGHARVR